MDGPSGRHGQNAAWNYGSVTSAVNGWYSEESMYDYNSPSFSAQVPTHSQASRSAGADYGLLG